MKGRGLGGGQKRYSIISYQAAGLTSHPQYKTEEKKGHEAVVWKTDSLGLAQRGLVGWQWPALLPSPDELDLGCGLPPGRAT